MNKQGQLIILIIVVLWGAVSFILLSRSRVYLVPEASIILLKLPRSGSSWLTDLLNQQHNVFVSKEIIQSNQSHRFSTKDVVIHLNQALLYPKDKLVARENLLPTGRFFDDFIRRRKFASILKYIGFSLNPEHISSIEWDKVVSGVPNPKVVVLIRHNAIKAAISGYYGRKSKSACGLSNSKASNVDCVDRILQQQVTWSPIEFAEEVNSWLGRYKRLLDFVNFDPTLSSLPRMIVSYEAMQLDAEKNIQKLIDFFGANQEKSSELVENIASSWLKRSKSEKTRDILKNFQAINASLSHSSCACIQAQLLSDRVEFFSACNSRIKISEGVCI